VSVAIIFFNSYYKKVALSLEGISFLVGVRKPPIENFKVSQPIESWSNPPPLPSPSPPHTLSSFEVMKFSKKFRTNRRAGKFEIQYLDPGGGNFLLQTFFKGTLRRVWSQQTAW
jgi:hypothetical protein